MLEYQTLHGIRSPKPLTGAAAVGKTVASSLEMLKHEIRRGGKSRQALVDKLRTTSNTNSTDTQALQDRLKGLRPRFIGALTVYSLLTQRSYADMEAQGGLDAFRLLWYTGGIQDDFIDELGNFDPQEDDKTSRTKIKKTIFHDEQEGYQAPLQMAQESMRNAQIPTPERTYINKRIAEWYQYLIRQEANVLKTPFEDYSYAYSRNYRETQNLAAGRMLVAVLNGRNSLDERLQRTESLIPRFSYLTQIVDDIADLPEDISAQRPSYAVGALNEHPAEMDAVTKATYDRNIKKMTPKVFKALAPQASSLVHAQFETYQQQLEMDSDKNAKGLSLLAQGIHQHFPRIRDFLYKINPQYANF